MKKIVFKTIKFLFFSLILSNFVPERLEMYPGIKGRTQEDKKLINQDKKAIENVVFI